MINSIKVLLFRVSFVLVLFSPSFVYSQEAEIRVLDGAYNNKDNEFFMRMPNINKEQTIDDKGLLGTIRFNPNKSIAIEIKQSFDANKICNNTGANSPYIKLRFSVSSMEYDFYPRVGHHHLCRLLLKEKDESYAESYNNSDYVDIYYDIPGYESKMHGWYRIHKQGKPVVSAPKKRAPLAVKQAPKTFNASELPTFLTAVESLPFPSSEAGKEWASDFGKNSKFSLDNKECLVSAYPYLRSQLYNKNIDDRLGEINSTNVHVRTTGDTLLTKSAIKEMCTDKYARAAWEKTKKLEVKRESVFLDIAKDFAYVCDLLDSASEYHPTSSSLALSRNYFDSPICLNEDVLAKDALNACQASKGYDSYGRTDSEYAEYCECSSAGVVNIISTGPAGISSNTLVAATTKANLTCSDNVYAFSQNNSTSSKIIDASQTLTARNNEGYAQTIQDESVKEERAPAVETIVDNVVENVVEDVIKDTSKKIRKFSKGLKDLF